MSTLMRRFRRTPLFFAAACALLVIAIAGLSAMFAVINGVVLRPLPVRDEASLVAVHLARPGTPRGPASAPLLDAVRQAPGLAGAAAAFQWTANMADEIETERLQGMRVTGDYFALTGTPVALGRTLTAADSAPDSPGVVLISDGLWTRRFGGAQSVIGSPLRLNGELFTIVGVLPPGFPSQIRDVDVIAPWVQERDPRRSNAALGFLRVVARLDSGVSRSKAQEGLDRTLETFRRTYPTAVATEQALAVVPLRDDLLGSSRSMLLLLATAMCIVTLIAVTNLASLFMVHVANRGQEFATRKALGATNRQVAAQMLSEALGIGLAGGLLGLVGASVLLQIVLATARNAIPRSTEVSIDATAAVFGIALSLFISVLAMVPSGLRVSFGSERLVASERWATSAGRRWRAGFVCAQVALSVTLIASAALLLRSYAAVQRVQPGFESRGVLSLRLSLPRAKYPATKDLARFTTELAARIGSVPGVEDVAAANVVPMNGYLATSTVGVPGLEAQPVDTWPQAHYRMISPRYFAVMRIPVAGRTFSEADDASSVPVAIISRGLAARYWPGKDAVGEQLRVRDDANTFRTLLIVGVAGDVRHLGLEVDSPAEVYVPIPQVPDATSVWLANNMYWVARTSGEPGALANSIRREVAGFDRDVATSFIRTMDAWLDQSVQARRFNLRVVVVFALTALLLTTIGVYGIAAEAVAMRRREIGVRAALGATNGELLALMMKEGVLPLAGGVAAGLALAAGAANLLGSFLYGIQPHDWRTFSSVAVLVSLVGALAYFIPATRAARVDPVMVLRGD